MTSILIIGADGFIGSNLVEYFKALPNFTVDGVGRHIPEKPYDYVINCAAKIHAPFQELVESNLSAAIYYALSYLRLNPLTHYLHVGSSSEYGNVGDFYEGAVCYPDSDYAKTKLLATEFLLNHTRYPYFLNVIRPFSVYGPKDLKTKFIPTLINSYKEKKKITVYEGSHDWIYIKDFCDLCKIILDSSYSSYIFNAGTGISTTNLEVIQTVEKITGYTFNKSECKESYRSYDKDYWASDNIRVKSMFKWKPKYTLEQGLNELLK